MIFICSKFCEKINRRGMNVKSFFIQTHHYNLSITSKAKGGIEGTPGILLYNLASFTP
jgi:hypothetical protein